MTVNLVIVESAAKAKTIQGYLNRANELAGMGRWVVMASAGHIKDLPAKTLGVDTTTWAVTYVAAAGKARTVAALKRAAANADTVWLASDPDREGAAIAWHLARELKLGPSAIRRIVFHEITPAALVHAVRHPTGLDLDLIAAQETRRILDRVVGYQLSPVLWHHFPRNRGLSAGRVQSVALRLLVDRAAEAHAHEARAYWTLTGKFEIEADKSVDATAYRDAKIAAFWEAAAVQDLLRALATVPAWTARTTHSVVAKSPAAPFTTSTLQQEAYHRHRLSSKATMALAQTLYEKGHITYMRTDSVGLSKDAQAALVAYVGATYGEGLARARQFKTRAANAQEAHEAIRPTRPEVGAEALADQALSADHKRLYDLIRRRAIASQMAAAEYDEERLVFEPEGLTGLSFVAKHSTLIEPGYLLVYSPEVAKEAKNKRATASTTTAATALSFQANGNVTQPPAQYNEPGLVKALEKNGIGRPSTYATIMDKLFQKGYVVKGAVPVTTMEVATWRVAVGGDVEAAEAATVTVGSKEADRMLPTTLGAEVTTCLAGVAPMILDVDFTSRMEADLDCISKGEKKKVDVLGAFYGPFREALGDAGNGGTVKTRKKKA